MQSGALVVGSRGSDLRSIAGLIFARTPSVAQRIALLKITWSATHLGSSKES
jgi:hypothetical protein